MNYPLIINGRVYAHFSVLAELIKTSPSPQSKEGIGLLQVLLDGVLQEKIQAWANSNEEAQHVLERMNELLPLTEDTCNLPDSVLMERLVSCFGSDYVGRTINIHDYISFEVTALKHGEEDLNTESNDIGISDITNDLAMLVRLDIRRILNEILIIYFKVGEKCSNRIEIPINTSAQSDSYSLAINNYQQEEDACISLIAEVAGRKYIIWQKSIRYTPTIRYYANGGSGEMSSQVCEKDVSTPLSKNLFTRENYYFCGWNTQRDGSGCSYKEQEDISISSQTNLYAQWKKSKGTENDHEWVDLGLPSGLKWATCNIGASSPEGCGDYFAWGETSPKDTYKMNNYKYYLSGNTLGSFKTSKYNDIDNKTILDPEDDAARTNWGGKWRMPTNAEIEELETNCTWSIREYDDVVVCCVKGVNGNRIILPFGGIIGNNKNSNLDLNLLNMRIMCYWGSNRRYQLYRLIDKVGHDLSRYAGGLLLGIGLLDSYYCGATVRAVCP